MVLEVDFRLFSAYDLTPDSEIERFAEVRAEIALAEQIRSNVAVRIFPCYFV